MKNGEHITICDATPMNETYTQEEVYQFLDNLRESGVTNMFGAGPYIQQEFPEVSRYESHRLLNKWMVDWNKRHSG